MKRSIFSQLLLVAFCILSCIACQQPKSELVLQSFPLNAVTLTDSWVKEREELNTAYLHSLDADRLVHNFKVNAGLESNAQSLEGWEAPWSGLRGHFTGHYLSAASALVYKNNDSLLAARLNYMVDELEKCQQALGDGGNLSAFPERDFDHIETYFTGVWAPYYTYNKVMQGLLHTYLYIGNEKAYRMVLKMADYVGERMERLDVKSRKRMLQMLQANPQNEVGAMNEVLYALYGVSKESKHLELARVFEPEWMMKYLLKSEDALSGLHANTHIVLVNGYAKSYDVTGDVTYRLVTENFWNMLIQSHAYANGTSSGPRPNPTTPTAIRAEHWGIPNQLAATLSGEIAESCVTHNTQKLSASLFSWTGDARYADAYMNTFYNGVMALQSAHTGRCTYHLPLGSPRDKKWLTENDFRCCNGSSIEAFATLNNNIYFHDGTNLWVNMYIPTTLNWEEQGISLSQQGEFPLKPQVVISIDSVPEVADFTLNLFIPSWAKGTQISINAEDAGAASPMSYKSIHRTWKAGDRIVLDFAYDFHVKPMPDDKNVMAIFYGPMMLAFVDKGEIVLKGSVEVVLQGLSRENDKDFYLQNGDRKFCLTPFFLIENETYSVYVGIDNRYF